MHILVVEDEQRMARLIQRVLTAEGYVVDIVHDGETGLFQAEDGGYDLIVLDRMLPITDGMEVCRKLRAQGVALPVLMLTARGEIEDRVEGLNAGADDYLTKPFAMAELIARIAALLRRREREPEMQTSLQVGDLMLDLVRHSVARGGKNIELTAKEFALLEYLMRHKGQVLTRAQITDHVWRYDMDAISNVVDTYMHYLRDKIDRGYAKPLLKTVRSVGYKIED